MGNVEVEVLFLEEVICCVGGICSLGKVNVVLFRLF